ncbi:tripartite tricarboxylate transporter TctB family protein [Salinisphaera aquimarina]|uniref:Tripartite tricarboxylate transporter TctB family protein n=1 Tax=Salinisphaera aquimarina TaxID=2094031 RepID=A0ABV7ENV1_9GAMM
MKLNDRVFGIAMLVLAVAYGAAATRFPEPFGGSEMVGPDTFPLILAVVLAGCSLYLISRPDPDNPWPSARTGMELVLAVIVLIAYTALLVPLGFIIATALAVGTLSWRMGAPAWRAYLTGLIAGVVVFFLFTLALDLPLPTGPLGVLEEF